MSGTGWAGRKGCSYTVKNPSGFLFIISVFSVDQNGECIYSSSGTFFRFTRKNFLTVVSSFLSKNFPLPPQRSSLYRFKVSFFKFSFLPHFHCISSFFLIIRDHFHRYPVGNRKASLSSSGTSTGGRGRRTLHEERQHEIRKEVGGEMMKRGRDI